MSVIRNILSLIFLWPFFVTGQIDLTSSEPLTEINFISDTQQPMRVEQIILKSNHNIEATALLFTEILKVKPKSLYMLGDVVSLGYRNNRWEKVDIFLDSCRKEDISVFGALGNHDVMGRKNKGERNFNKRFPENVRTGYVSVIDSVAVIILNSNFSKLSKADEKKQNKWYQSTIDALDKEDSIKVIIVSCHHAPYSNSLIVKSSVPVQQNFVPAYIKSKKAQLFITGHAHAFEHFNMQGKHFLVIGGGGGLHQPMADSNIILSDLSTSYKPFFHYLSILKYPNQLKVNSIFLKEDFSGFGSGHSFTIDL